MFLLFFIYIISSNDNYHCEGGNLMPKYNDNNDRPITASKREDPDEVG